MTMTEVAETVSNIRERIDIPLVVDGDTGFGNALNVQRTVRLFERMGASGIQLEDQTMPKRCGHLEGKQLVPVAEMQGKIHAALDARTDDDTLIVARTDAIAVTGIEEALDRGAAYIEAGADVLFVESPLDDAQLAEVGRVLGARIPLLANMVEGGKTPLHSADELGKLGFKLVIFPGAMVRVLSRAGAEYLAALRRDGTTAGILDRMFDFNQVNDLIGTDELIETAEKYS
jgi:2-methylisocitrate lyase-like PEP mutase family enzyme